MMKKDTRDRYLDKDTQDFVLDILTLLKDRRDTIFEKVPLSPDVKKSIQAKRRSLLIALERYRKLAT